MSDATLSDTSGAVRHEAPKLRDALRQARIEAAQKSGVVVDLRDAELARLEILSEALDPLFAEIPDRIDLFDRAISAGETPRLWVDVVAHVAMGRDKRIYRLLQDTRLGRLVLAESHDVPTMVGAITDYVARRMVEREYAMAPLTPPAPLPAAPAKRRSRFWPFVFGMVIGAAALFGAAIIAAHRTL